MTTGNISVQAENIFPIIKKFLYSDQEIFLRELVSNAVDATTKLRTLAKRGEATGEIGDTTIEILIDEAAKTLTIRDKGIGMTQEECEKYLNQVAFSGATEFIEKYQGEASIIGHFGLGFYSAFMVADRVDVVTRSFREGAQAVKWSCDGTPQYSIETAEKAERGTDVILHISADSEDFLEQSRIQSLLTKYCKFLPNPIQFGTKEDHETKEVTPNIVNNPSPAWKKAPNELTETDYKNFYEELYPFSTAPLFWIHLNIDYPFNLTGILYFPKLNNALEIQKNKIQLYSNQVYVTDDVKEIMPEFLTLLHGVIDSPDIPLNVSRSYLQSDKEVKKITAYITRKVADKLSELFREDRKNYEAKWTEIGTFVKYGMLSDEKFHERAMEFALFKNLDGQYFTFEEYKEKVKATQTDKYEKTIFIYTNDRAKHDTFIASAQARGYDILEADTLIDNHFHQHLEYKGLNISFVRVDAATADDLVPKDEKTESILTETEQDSVRALFTTLLTDQNGSAVEIKALSTDDQPVQIVRSEFMRRMKEMQTMQGSGGMTGLGEMGDFYSVVVNANSPIIAQKLMSATDKPALAKHLYDLALLNQGMLSGAALSAFIRRSLEMV